MSGAVMQRPIANNGTPNTDNGNSLRINSNRNEINNRFPSLGFHIETGSRSYFEVLLTVDRNLFDPLRAAERQPNNFYSSRQDSGLIATEDGNGIYLVPPVVLRAFAQSLSKTGHIYYTLIAYDSALGDNPVLKLSTEQLVQTAPSVIVSNDFTGTTLSHVLGAAVGRLRTVGVGGKVLAHTSPVTNHNTRSMELIRPFYDPTDPSSALMSQNNAFSIEREEWFVGVPNTRFFPHSAICQLIMTTPDGRNAWGTGFYIGTNRVLTCAHNLSGMSSVMIIPGRNGAGLKPYGEVSMNSSSWRIAPAYSGEGDWNNDLAVIDNVSLAAPNGQFFNFLHATPSDQMPVVVCGYSASSRAVPELDKIIDGDMQHLHGGYVRSQSNPEVIEYPILTLRGASGSPVYHLSSESGQLEALITGVHVSSEPAANGLNLGCFITPAKIDWIEGRTTSFSSGRYSGRVQGIPNHVAANNQGVGGKVLAHTSPSTKSNSRSLELLRPFYDPADPASALMCQNNAFSIEREEWFAGVPNTSLFPHSAICQLIMTTPDGRLFQGTGFYIGANRVLTCAHNLSGKSSVMIIPGRNGAGLKPYGEVSMNASSWRIAPTYSGVGDFNNDLAVIDNVSLAAPNDQFFNFLHATPSDQLPVVVCGYSARSWVVPELDKIIDSDKQHLHGGYVHGQSNPEVFEYPILTLRGASGSPVYHLSSERGQIEALIIGVHVSGKPAASGLNRGCFITPDKIDWIEGRTTSFSSSRHSGRVQGIPNPVAANKQTTYTDEGEDASYGNMNISSRNNNGGITANRQPGNVASQPVQNNNSFDDFDYDDGYDDSHDNDSNGRKTNTALNSNYPDYGDDDFGLRASQPPLRNKHMQQDNSMDQIQGLSYQSLDNSLDEHSDVVPTNSNTGNNKPQNGNIELTAEAKKRIVEYIMQFESGEARFGAMNLDGEFRGRFGTDSPFYQKAHVGLSYGIIQFTQDSGNLGKLLQEMNRRDSERFPEVFGQHWNELIQVTTAQGPGSLNVESGRSARVQPVGGADLWEEPWTSRFRQAASHIPFQAAQNQLAAEIFLNPVVPYSQWLGISTERGIAMLYDRSVQLGVGGGMNFVVNAIGPVKTTAQRTEALAALGHESLTDFQQSVPGITVDGDWGKQSHAAMIAALRRLGTASPVEIPAYQQSLDLIVQAATGKKWAHRVRNLRNDSTLSDDYFVQV